MLASITHKRGLNECLRGPSDRLNFGKVSDPSIEAVFLQQRERKNQSDTRFSFFFSPSVGLTLRGLCGTLKHPC